MSTPLKIGEIVMNEFKTYHPIVNFIYFVLVIGCAMFLMHPICLGISLLCSFWYSVLLKGRRAIGFNLLYMLPTILLMGIMNPAFSHEGITILTYLPDGNPLTLESIWYGVAAAVMLVTVICWFSCYNAVMTSDKFVYLFGRVVPALSLVLSMALQFVPKFAEQTKRVANARQCIGKELRSGSILARAKNGLSVLSVMITWSLENAVITADSMKSRGYGLTGRTAFSVYRFDRRDSLALTGILLLGIYVLSGAIAGSIGFFYYPMLESAPMTLFGVSVFGAYLLLCGLPVFMEWREEWKWKAIESNM